MKNNYESAFLGLAVGDALGAPFERSTADRVESMIAQAGDLRMLQYARWDKLLDEGAEQDFPAGSYTDDTAQALCLADSLIEKGFDLDDQFARYQQWFSEGLNQPYGLAGHLVAGGTTKRVLAGSKPSQRILDGKGYDATSNGSLMRSLPMALAFAGSSDLAEKTRLASYVTHNNREAGDCCVIYTDLVSRVLRQDSSGSTLEDMKQNLSLGSGAQSVLESVDNESLVGPGNSALQTLRNVLWVDRHTNSYAEAIEKVIRIGGDTDTYAAILGGLSGARYGSEMIPEKWIDPLFKQEEIRGVALNLYEFNQFL